MDNYKNLDINSAYMYFKTTVDLANYLGKADLSTLKSEEDAVYFPFLKGNTIVLSNFAMFVFSCFVGVITLIWIVCMLLRKEIRFKDYLYTVSILCLTLIGTAIIGFAGTLIYSKVWNPSKLIELVGTLNGIFYATCLLTIIFILILIWIITIRMKFNQTILLSTLLLFNLVIGFAP